MNEQTQNEEQMNTSTETVNQPKQPNQPDQPEYTDKPLPNTQSSVQTMDKSCGSVAAAKPLSEQMKGAGSATTVQTISKDQLLEIIKSNSGVQIVNVLSPEYYGKGFIKGSLKIPLEQLDSRMGELDKTKEVVTYCASSTCSASMKAAEKLAANDFKVKAYEGGINEWSEAGLPTDK